jgi:hypothetical protein
MVQILCLAWFLLLPLAVAGAVVVTGQVLVAQL